ncbi:MAG: glycosyltransferase family 2 protein, partial [Acidimicrobiales bacterium]
MTPTVKNPTTRKRVENLPLLQRFDDESVPPITPHEMNVRWTEFHRQIRRMSGTRLQRTAGRILGEDTLRYKAARFTFRPLLKFIRKFKKTTKKKSTVVFAPKAATIFPVNYRPREIEYADELATLNLDVRDVEIVEVDAASMSIEALITSLNKALNETAAEWLLLADAESSENERRYCAGTLLAHATTDDDVVYADEPGPHRFAPLLKSAAVGPHTLLSYNAIGRPALIRVETLFGVGGFSPDAGWAFEHDAYLRLNEAAARFRHVTRVLPLGRPSRYFDDAVINEDTCRVVQRAIDRRGWRGRVVAGDLAGLVHWDLDPPETPPSIDIIIPTRDRIDLVRACITAIEEKTTYPNYDIIILDNDSAKTESLDYFATSKYRVVPCPGPFNYAHIVNRGVQHSSADFVV